MGDENKIIVPFLKWAGGKRWLVSNNFQLFPTSFNRYIEPFLGSGAVFFSLRPRQAILSDLNADLIKTYRAIRDDWRKVVRVLGIHDKNHSANYYYEIRESTPSTKWSHAARFIYLNRTCWNGLYRVNLNGEFNVPIGTKTNVLLESDKFAEISKLLVRSKIFCTDFETTINSAGNNDFLFVDPPYTVKHKLNGFIKYNENLFGWKDQIRLRDSLYRAANRGAVIMLTNADHSSIRKLYGSKFKLLEIERHSVLSASAKFRKKVDELVITNYL